MRQPRHAPRLVDRGDANDAVAQDAGDRLGEIGEAVAGVAVRPAAKVGQGRGHLPMIKRLERLQPARKHPVDKAVIEIKTFGVDVHPIRHDPRPSGGKPVGVQVRRLQQVQVLRPAVKVVAGHGAGFGAHHIAGGGGERVPVAGAAAAEGRAFDLIGGGCGAKDKAGRKVETGQHGAPSVQGFWAGPVDWPMINSASSRRCWGPSSGWAMT